MKNLIHMMSIDKAIKVICRRHKKYSKLKNRTKLLVSDIMEHLKFMLSTISFSFRCKIYPQKFGRAMRSPVFPVVANCIQPSIRFSFFGVTFCFQKQPFRFLFTSLQLLLSAMWRSLNVPILHHSGNYISIFVGITEHILITSKIEYCLSRG